MVFQGECFAEKVALPKSIQAGDILAIHETGAYTMSMFSKVNSLTPNPVYGFSVRSMEIFCFKERESYNETLSFWGTDVPTLV